MSLPRYIEVFFYISGNSTDRETFIDNITTAFNNAGWNTGGLPFSTYKTFSITTTDITIRQDIYDIISAAYVTGLTVHVTISDNVLQWP